MQKIIVACFCILLVLFSSISFAQVSDVKLTDNQLDALNKVLSSANVLQRLQNSGSITKDEFKNQLDFVLKDANQILGKSVTIEEVTNIIRNTKKGQVMEAIEVANNAPQLETNQSVNFTEKVIGMISFVNLVLATSALMVVLGLAWLFILYILPHIIGFMGKFPKEFYEIILYTAVVVSFIFSVKLQATVGMYLALLGCFGLPFVLSLTFYLHEDRIKKGTEHQILFFVCSLVYIAMAVILQAWFIGLLAVLAVMAFLGFSVIVMPGVYCIGFEDKDAVARGTIAAFIVVAAFVTFKVLGINVPYIQVFSVGALYAGSFVFFLGLLISSSKWFSKDQYLLVQAVMIIACVASLFIGSVYHINELRGFAGTFLYLYLMEKYFEIPHLSKHWAWATFIFGLILYVFAMVIKAYPEYFLTSLF